MVPSHRRKAASRGRLADFLANEMLIIDPASRSTAMQCREAVPKADLVLVRQLPHPPQRLNDAQGAGDEEGDQEAARLDEVSSSISSLATESARRLRSGAPEPSIDQTSKRPRRQTTASGSSSSASNDRQSKRQLTDGNAQYFHRNWLQDRLQVGSTIAEIMDEPGSEATSSSQAALSPAKARLNESGEIIALPDELEEIAGAGSS